MKQMFVGAIAIVVASGALLDGCNGGSGGLQPVATSTPTMVPTATATPISGSFVAGQLLVKYEGGPSSQIARNANAAVGATVIDSLDLISLVRLPDGLSVPDAIRLYLQQPGVLGAQPNYIYSAAHILGQARAK